MPDGPRLGTGLWCIPRSMCPMLTWWPSAGFWATWSQTRLRSTSFRKSPRSRSIRARRPRCWQAPYREGNFLWHIDGATDAVPQKATVLTARVVDEAGGDAEFASTYAAYNALPKSQKDEIAALRAVHSFAWPPSCGRTRTQLRKSEPRGRRCHRGSIPWCGLGVTAASPCCWAPPAERVVGWPAREGRALLEGLEEWATQDKFVLRHEWRVGDLVVWDNTGMLHRALPFTPTSPR